MLKKLRQEIIFSETRIIGTYCYRDIFQLRPIPEDATAIPWSIGHHPAILEYSFNCPDISETNYNPKLPEHVLLPMIETEASSVVKKWILLVLSTFTKHRLFQYSNSSNEQKWFIKLSKDKSDSEIPASPFWGQEGYRYNGFSEWSIEKFSSLDILPISFIESNEYYNSETIKQYVVGKTPDIFELPDRINEFLDQYMELHELQKKGFLSSCFLFDQGIQLFFKAPSLSFAACVSSLETLIAVEFMGKPIEKCECCDQPKYYVRQKFLEFIKKYGSADPEARKVADKVYQRRSGILHEGQLFIGEIDQKTFDGSIDWINENQYRRNVLKFFRTCIMNWLIINNKNRKEAL